MKELSFHTSYWSLWWTVSWSRLLFTKWWCPLCHQILKQMLTLSHLILYHKVTTASYNVLFKYKIQLLHFCAWYYSIKFHWVSESGSATMLIWSCQGFLYFCLPRCRLEYHSFLLPLHTHLLENIESWDVAGERRHPAWSFGIHRDHAIPDFQTLCLCFSWPLCWAVIGDSIPLLRSSHVISLYWDNIL